MINICSIANTWGSHAIDDLNMLHDFPGYQFAFTYSRTKLYLTMFSRELAEREPSIHSMSVSPGVVLTMIARDMMGDDWAAALARASNAMWNAVAIKTAWQGAQTAIYLSVAPEVKSGSHYADCREDGGFLASIVGRAKERRRLWENTEALLKNADVK